MTPEEERKRLGERMQCAENHADIHVPTHGLGWTGTRCPVCGFSFFGSWEEWTADTLDTISDLSSGRR